MKLVDLNGKGGIGANSILCQLGPFRFVIDAGMHPKFAGWEAVPEFRLVEPGRLDFVILTHCHLDHLGSLPLLLRRQPRARVFGSLPTTVLAPHMLGNSCNIMKKQRVELGMPELPLYTRQDINQVRDQLDAVAYDKPRIFRAHGEEIEIRFFHAGHVAGASGISLNYKHRKIFFTGDVLFSALKTLPGARFPNGKLDTLFMETTRGTTMRAPGITRESEIERLFHTIDHTLTRKGSVLIPVFALGRMQEILSLVHEAREKGKIRPCPVYCSGLGVHLAHTLDSISKKTGFVNFRRKILKNLKARTLPRSPFPGKKRKGPELHILSSGMLVENTPSYHAAARLLDNHRNTVCFVGYCDPETPGGKLLASKPGKTFLFEALDYACPIHAPIEKFDLSGHAEREELMDFALRVNPRAVVLTHGEGDAREWFADVFRNASNPPAVLNPRPLETYRV